jgi:hypothetical protein
MDPLQWMLQPLPLYLISILGMLMHFFKKQIKGESIIEIRDYFKLHFKSTVVAFMATTIGFLAYHFLLASGQKADIFGVFGIGYMFDSTFNRWDNKETKVDDK